MEYPFQIDIISNILPHLDKDSSFNFLNISERMTPARIILYGRYLFNHCKIKNDKIKQYIRNIRVLNIKYATEYENLKSLQICDNDFNETIYDLPRNIKSLLILGSKFNQPLNNLPNTIRSLTILSCAFNQPLDNLPQSLETLLINNISNWSFNQPLDGLPQSLKTLIVRCNGFRHPLDQLPKTLQLLSFRCNRFDFPLDELPTDLQVLDIHCTNKIVYPFTNLPETLEKFSLVGGLMGERYDVDYNKLPKSLKSITIK